MANIVLGITGGIAAFKAAELTSLLVKEGHNIDVIMTDSATEFVQPLTFSSLTNNDVVTSMFAEKMMNTEHISFAKKADIVIIVPASANTIAKLANGIADNMLTTTILATRAPVLIAPAMNTNMFLNEVTQANIAKLEKKNFNFIMPEEGYLACGDIGVGKLANINVIKEEIDKILKLNVGILANKKVIVSAGPTIVKIDPVRYLTNYSSGKMGYHLADIARKLGAKEVVLVSGPTNLNTPNSVRKIDVKTTREMHEIIKSEIHDADVLIMAAAPADFTINYTDQKIKKQNSLKLEFTKDIDILKELGKNKNCIHVGFAAESQNLVENAKIKLAAKNLDLIVANDISIADQGFNSNDNAVTLITNNEIREIALMSKESLSYEIWQYIATNL